jgi:hypothetical protein
MPSGKSTPASIFDTAVVESSERMTSRAIGDLLSSSVSPRGVVVTAPAGAGKSHLVAAAVARLRDEGRRVAVAAPTNEQAFGLVKTIWNLYCRHGSGREVVFVPASNVELPDGIAALPGVEEREAKESNGARLIVGTLSKLGDAFSRETLKPFDVLLIDESYQADSGRYFAVGGLAPVHLLVGDGGQISPFSTMDNPYRWRGLPEDPLQTAVGVLLRNHPATPVHGMPITRRLDGRAAAIARLFYPKLAFAPAVLPGVRDLRLGAASGRPNLDRALDLASGCGWAHVQLPRSAVLQADPETVKLIADLVRRLFERGAKVRCERKPRLEDLRPEQVAVGVSHNDQKDFVRMALAERGLSGVVVETANKLQGLEFEVAVVWHPLAGLPEPDGFHLDPGRLCVLLTRHRQGCVVVGRVGDEEMLTEQVPPATPAYLGDDVDPVLDGWEVHRQVFDALEADQVAV